MPRRAVAQVPSTPYGAGVSLRLYGPDAAGAIDTAAPVQSGERLVHGPAEWMEWGESGWGEGAWIDGARWAGWAGTAWGEQPWMDEPQPVWLVTEPIEDGAFEIGMQAFDVAGESTLSVTVGDALVISAPARPASLLIAVAGGLVTVSF